MAFITELNDNQIFVFGSNLNGNHYGGAAAQAYKSFGAEWGVGEGLTGKCYAFPTLNRDMLQVTTRELEQSRDRLYKCAAENPHLEFLLTPVGTGIAGMEQNTIKDLFKELPANIIRLF